jgi:hypothetical protein
MGENFHLYRTIHGKMSSAIHHHELFLPEPVRPLSVSETETLQSFTTDDVTQLGQTSSEAKVYLNNAVQTLLEIHESRQRAEKRDSRFWHTILISFTFILAITTLLY